MYEEIRQHIFSRGTQRQINGPLKEQAFRGFPSEALLFNRCHMPILDINLQLKSKFSQQNRLKGKPSWWGQKQPGLLCGAQPSSGGSAPGICLLTSPVCRYIRARVPTGVNLVFLWHKCVRSLFRGCVCSAHTQHPPSEEHIFSGPFTVALVFKGCTGACLVFSAVPLWPSVPLPAVGGGGWGAGGLKAGSSDAGWAPI